ncbi:hypothetical protein [Cysteiniphilum sp. 6C5]|uniref:hypothetical protein n=1 Tax=unclassified Cysteiniphilum TaxID=2610889 RepID=UPI003F85F1F2
MYNKKSIAMLLTSASALISFDAFAKNKESSFYNNSQLSKMDSENNVDLLKSTRASHVATFIKYSDMKAEIKDLLEFHKDKSAKNSDAYKELTDFVKNLKFIITTESRLNAINEFRNIAYKWIKEITTYSKDTSYKSFVAELSNISNGVKYQFGQYLLNDTISKIYTEVDSIHGVCHALVTLRDAPKPPRLSHLKTLSQNSA